MEYKWHDLTNAEYHACTITSYIGGATWLRYKAGCFFVVPVYSPYEISRMFRKDPSTTIRAQLIPQTKENEFGMGLYA